MKLKTDTLYMRTRSAILDIIQEHPEFMTRLPSEQDLSDQLGVSRNTVREALRSLENEGIIASRHGIGTFVICSSHTMKHNLATLDSTTKIIANNGYTPGTSSVQCSKITVPEYLVDILNVPADSSVIYIERVRTADGMPVVYVEDFVPCSDEMYEEFSKAKETPLFDFLASYNLKPSFANCSLHSVLSNKKLQNKLSINQAIALLQLNQTHYTAKGTPAFYSKSYFITEKIEFNIIRKCVE